MNKSHVGKNALMIAWPDPRVLLCLAGCGGGLHPGVSDGGRTWLMWGLVRHWPRDYSDYGESPF